MNAASLLSDLAEVGISVKAEGRSLRVRAAAGVVPNEVRAQLQEAKSEILDYLAALVPTRARLVNLASLEGISLSVSMALPDEEVAAAANCSDATLVSWLRALEASHRVEQGLVPSQYADAKLCELCGPVFLWKSAPSVVAACPWCLRRRAGKAFPRPNSTCESCRAFLPGQINPEGAMGRCQMDGSRAYWPRQAHPCPDWRPLQREGGCHAPQT